MSTGHLHSGTRHDLEAYGERVRAAHESAVADGPTQMCAAGDGPRGLISASWRRSLAAGVDPESRAASLVYDHGDLGDVRAAHPLHPLLPVLAHTLLGMADETGHIMVVTDAEGRILWRDGNHNSMRRADQVGLTDGFNWAERAIGTNGMGTALAVRRPVHVYATEHLIRALHLWSCSAAPITDPDTGELLGSIDISGTRRSLHPATVALVSAAAHLAESHLELRMRERDDRLRARYEAQIRSRRDEPFALVTRTGRVIAGDPAGHWGDRIHLPIVGDRVTRLDGQIGILEPLGEGFLLRTPDRTGAPPSLRLAFLGTEPPQAWIDGRRVILSLRHAEILALLALNPRGMTAEQLSFHLYGDDGNPVTIRAEIHRLRAQLGGAVAAKPYRLATSVQADFLDLQRLLSDKDATAVARAYTGPLLPRSEAPEIRRERDELEGQVRARLLLSGAADDLWTYAQTEGGREDYEVLERVNAMLPPGDHRAVAARIRLRA
ncbi:GAF domain-containing protein [Sinosporangium album]|uniref:GAF domain-containing protein n=1 Tax=Sinosporangium album TaxID=504805 RepID=A0A1G8FHQ5_9ACTN|nr:helix-turn-helix domain-containing protein [Sinosporangium album]SDH81681.1 GAF domain-containing protein [Sinosporangium album]